ncbi:Glucan endo-1,3-beta-D-glucosidase-like protein [Drosera capensis]
MLRLEVVRKDCGLGHSFIGAVVGLSSLSYDNLNLSSHWSSQIPAWLDIHPTWRSKSHELCLDFFGQEGLASSHKIIIHHASVVMNAYYQKNGRHSWNCNFTGSALRVVTDPSYCSCSYVFS